MTLSFKKPIILTRINQDNKDFVNLFLSTYKLENIKNCFKCLPLIEIVLEKKTKETIGSNPLIFTSRHGVQAISLMSNMAEKEIFCVGQCERAFFNQGCWIDQCGRISQSSFDQIQIHNGPDRNKIASDALHGF